MHRIYTNIDWLHSLIRLMLNTFQLAIRTKCKHVNIEMK
jgi:hypothetical protein